MAKYKLVEKRNHLAVHALFDTLERAEHHMNEVVPVYIAKGYFMDKTLRIGDFEIMEIKR